MNTETTTTAATIVRTAKGFTLTYLGETTDAYGRTTTIGKNYTHVVLYRTGGWEPATQASTGWCLSRHKSEAAAAKAAADPANARYGVLGIFDLTAI